MKMSIYWIDSEGKKCLIEYMSDRYLLNCIRFVENKMEQNPNYRPIPAYYNLIKEYDRRINEI
jgi:hypothetical protein